MDKVKIRRKISKIDKMIEEAETKMREAVASGGLQTQFEAIAAFCKVLHEENKLILMAIAEES